jgi:hypothetical protein
MSMPEPMARPPSAGEVLELSFLENRARVLEIAAFLDRIERSPGADAARRDFRYLALVRAIGLLLAQEGGRASAVHLSLSDPTTEPIASAAGMKGASGAWRGAAE